MKIRLKDRILLTAAFFRALGTKGQNSVVAVVHEESPSLVLSSNLGESFVKDFTDILEARRQRIAAGHGYDGGH